MIRSRGLLAAFLALVLSLAPALAGVRPRPAPSVRHGDPVLVVMEGRDDLVEVLEFPREERLAGFRSYRLTNPRGERVGDLVRLAYTRHPSYLVVGQAGATRGKLILDRAHPGTGFQLHGPDFLVIGRWFPLRVVFREYEWRQNDGTVLAAIVPRPNSRFWEIRGGAEAAAALRDLGIPVEDPPAVRKFRLLHGEP